MNSSDASDVLNPVLLKELRQSLKSRSFGFAFLLMQGLMVIAIATELLAAQSGGRAGAEFFGRLFWILTGAPLLLFLPMLAINAIYTEHHRETLSLVLLTGLSAWRMVVGKWASLMAQALLIASTALPCVVLRYYLGGVNVARDLLALTLIVGACGVLCAAGLLLSTVKKPWRAFWIGLSIFLVFSPLMLGIVLPLVFFFYAMSARPDLIPLQLLLASGALLHWAAGRYVNHRAHERVAPRIYSLLTLMAVILCIQAAGKFPPVIMALPPLLPPLAVNLLDAAEIARPQSDRRRRAAVVFAGAIVMLVFCLLTQDLPGPGRIYFFATLSAAIAVPAYGIYALRKWIHPFAPMLIVAEIMLMLFFGVAIALAAGDHRALPAAFQILPVSSFIVAAIGQADPAFEKLNVLIAAIGVLAMVPVAITNFVVHPRATAG